MISLNNSHRNHGGEVATDSWVARFWSFARLPSWSKLHAGICEDDLGTYMFTWPWNSDSPISMFYYVPLGSPMNKRMWKWVSMWQRGDAIRDLARDLQIDRPATVVLAGASASSFQPLRTQPNFLSNTTMTTSHRCTHSR